jgi:uncharacterized protein
VPDEVELQIRITEYDHEKKHAIEHIQAQLVEKLSAAGIAQNKIIQDDIQGNYYYWRYYWDWNYWYYPQNRPYISKQVTVKLESMKQASKVVESLKMRGISNISLGQSTNKKIHEYRKQVKLEAIKAAREKAQYMLEGIGNTLGNVVSVKEIVNDNNYRNQHYWWGYPYYTSNNSISNSNMSVGTVGGEGNEGDEHNAGSKNIKLRYEVEVVFEIKTE